MLSLIGLYLSRVKGDQDCFHKGDLNGRPCYFLSLGQDLLSRRWAVRGGSLRLFLIAFCANMHIELLTQVLMRSNCAARECRRCEELALAPCT
jgi:hypothetical protein